MTPKKNKSGKILFSLAGLFGCGLVSLLAAIAVPNTAAGQADSSPVEFHNGWYVGVEFALSPQNCDSEPAERHEGVQRLEGRRYANLTRYITLSLANDCDWVGTLVGCNAAIEFKNNSLDSDIHPPGPAQHSATDWNFTLTKGRPLQWNGHPTQAVTMSRHPSNANLGCNTFFDATAHITLPTGAAVSDQAGNNMLAGTVIPVTFTGATENCQLVVDRIPQASNVVEFTVAADGRVTPTRVSAVNTAFGDGGNACHYDLSFPETAGNLSLKSGTATDRIGAGLTGFKAEYEVSAGVERSAKPAIALAADSDTGYSNSDSITTSTTPTIEVSNMVVDSWGSVQAKVTRSDGTYATIVQTFQASQPQVRVNFDNGDPSQLCTVTIHGSSGEVLTQEIDTENCALLQPDLLEDTDNSVWEFTATQFEPGKLPTAADPLQVTLDNTAPRLDRLTSDPATVLPGGTSELTIAVSQPVYGFDAADFEVSGGTVSNLAADPSNNRLYTATFTAANETNQARISVIADSFTDLAGGGIDNLDKTLTIPVLEASAKPTIDLDAGFDTANNSDNITRRNAPRFTVANLSNGAAVEVAATRAQSDGGSLVIRKSENARSYSKWFGFGFGNEGGNCDHLRYDSVGVVVSRVVNRGDCSLGDGVWTVVATSRQPGRAPTLSDPLVVTIDTEIQDAPDISFDAARVQVGGTATVTFKFSEPVSGFDLENDVLVTTGDEISDLAPAPGDNSTYTATFTAGDETGTSTVWAGIGIRGYSDIAGNTKVSAVKHYANIRVTTQAPPTTTTTTTTTVPEPEPEPEPEPTPTTVPADPTGLNPTSNARPVDPGADPDPLTPPDSGSGIAQTPGELPTPVAALSPESGFDNISTVGSPVFVLANLRVGAEIEARVRHDAPNSSTGDFTELKKTFDVTAERMELQFNNRALGDGPCEMLASSYGWPVAIDEAKSEDCIFLPSEQGLWTLTIIQRRVDAAGNSSETHAAPLEITFRLPSDGGRGEEDGEREGGGPVPGATPAGLPNLGVFEQSPGVSLTGGGLSTSSDEPTFLLENLLEGEKTHAELRYQAPDNTGDFATFSKEFSATSPTMKLNFANPASGGNCQEESQLGQVRHSSEDGDCRLLPDFQGQWHINVVIPRGSATALFSDVFTFTYDPAGGPAPQPEPQPEPNPADAGLPGLGVVIAPLTVSLNADSGEGTVATRPVPTFVLENLVEGLEVRADLVYSSDPNNEDSDHAFFAKRFTATGPTMELNFSDPNSGGSCRSSTSRNGVIERTEAGACQFQPSEQGSWQLVVEQVLSNGNGHLAVFDFEFRLPGPAAS